MTQCLGSAMEEGDPVLKVIGYTFRGSNSVIFSFTSLLKWGQSLKERVCFSGSNFYPLKVGLFLEVFQGSK